MNKKQIKYDTEEVEEAKSEALVVTDKEILSRCRRVFRKDGCKIHKAAGGFFIYDANGPVTDGLFCWHLDHVLYMALLSQERQIEHLKEQQQQKHRKARTGS